MSDSSNRNIQTDLQSRLRNRRWAESNRGCVDQNVWLAGPPPYGPHLSGGAMTVRFSPAPRWPMQLRNARGLHGAMTAIHDRPHTRWPAWSIFPYAGGWAIYWVSDDDAVRFAGRTISCALWDRPTDFVFGPMARMRTPAGLQRARRTVRVDALTPIVTRSDGGLRPCTSPTDETILGSLRGELLYRLSPTHRHDAPGEDLWTRWVAPRVALRIVDKDTEPVHIDLAGKLGTASGWHGHIVVEANAVARWLLTVCERGIGLGYRTAFGMGRIRVTAC